MDRSTAGKGSHGGELSERADRRASQIELATALFISELFLPKATHTYHEVHRSRCAQAVVEAAVADKRLSSSGRHDSGLDDLKRTWLGSERPLSKRSNSCQSILATQWRPWRLTPKGIRRSVRSTANEHSCLDTSARNIR